MHRQKKKYKELWRKTKTVYNFTCPLCKRVYQKDIKMSEYDTEKEEQFCEDDNTKLERVLEPFSGSIQLSSGMYGTSQGGWNS